MNDDSQAQQTTADEQQLADLLAQNQPANSSSTGLQFEETPVDTGTQLPEPDASADASTPDTSKDEDELNALLNQPATHDEVPATPPPMPDLSLPKEETPAAPTITPAPSFTPPTPAAGGSLDNLKKDALEELRPLVDKLDLPADEKFDTLLLIIRSTDDQSLLAPAHEAAKAITDDTKRAQALLDVIKEIDYFSQQK